MFELWKIFLNEKSYWNKNHEGNPFDDGDRVKSIPKTGRIIRIDYSRETLKDGWTPIQVKWDDDNSITWIDYEDLERI